MSGVHRIDECLSTRDGRLFIEERDTVALVEQFGSPIFVVSEDQLRRNVRRFHKAFSAHWTDGPVDVLPAIKANWTLATRRILTEEGAGADIYSEGELYAALTSGADPERISFNGGGKSEAFLRKCIEAGVRITVEDLDEPDLIEKVASELNRKARIRLRVKPNFPNLWRPTDFSQEYATIDLGIQVYKSGIPAQYLAALGKKILNMKHVELKGLHFHGGRHHASLWYWKGMIRQYARLIAELCRAWDGYHLEEIDIGGGFASRRDPHNKLELRRDVILTWFTYPFQTAIKLLGARRQYGLLSRMIALFVRSPGKRRAPAIEQYAETAVRTLCGELSKNGIDTRGVRLQVEPGRCLYGNSGIHLTRVKKFKRQTEPMRLNWVLTDTTYFFLTGGVYEYNFHDFRIANKTDASLETFADIVGHSCYEDRILPFARIPELDPGDIIAFLDTGAYQEVSASNFNALPRPATVLVTGDRAEVIKRAETVGDVYARDIIPVHLEGK